MEAIWATVLLLAVAMVLGAIFERFKQSAILGYLMAGAIVGPHALNILGAHDQQTVEDVSEVGVALLLFTIGLEFSLERLRSFGWTPWLLGSGQVFGTLALVTLCTAGFVDFKLAVSLGAVMALSSTAVTLRTLSDRSELDSIPGRNALGVLLFQDVMVVPLIVFVTAINGDGSAVEVVKYMAKEVVYTILLVAGMFGITHWGMPLLVRLGLLTGANREVPVLFAVVAAGGAAFVAHEIGLSAALGAFVAGVMLGESVLATQIRADVGGIKTVFVTLFFSSVGMLADPNWILHNLLPVAGTLVAVVLGKTLVVFVVALILKMRPRHALASGLMVAQIGEFSFVVLAAMKPDPELNNLIIAATIGSLLVTPFLIAGATPLGRMIERGLAVSNLRRGASQTITAVVAPVEATRGVVVIGYGPAGRLVAARLKGTGRPVTVLDLNARAIAEAAEEGFIAQVGDVTQRDVLEHAGVAQALAVVVTVPDHRVAGETVRQVRNIVPNATCIVRSRYQRFVPELTATGAAVVIDEEQAVGSWLAAEIIQRLPSDPVV